jgi:hypothetical protein
MKTPLLAMRGLALALCALLMTMTTRASLQQHISENDFVFPAPQAPFKFIDLPEPYASPPFAYVIV